MRRWALMTVDLTVIVNITEQDDEPGHWGPWIEVTGLHVGPGHTHNGGIFLPPAVVARITKRRFWQRFLVAEREALQNVIATGTQAQKNKINAFLEYAKVNDTVELDDPYIAASVNLLETAGIIGANRAASILTP